MASLLNDCTMIRVFCSVDNGLIMSCYPSYMMTGPEVFKHGNHVCCSKDQREAVLSNTQYNGKAAKLQSYACSGAPEPRTSARGEGSKCRS